MSTRRTGRGAAAGDRLAAVVIGRGSGPFLTAPNRTELRPLPTTSPVPQRNLAVPALALLLSACGGEVSSTCSAGFSGAELTTTTSDCSGCRVDNASAANDGNGGSGAQLIFNATRLNPAGGRISLTARGRAFGGGSTVGAYLQFPYSNSAYTNVAVSFVTYREGVQQEMLDGSSTGVGNIEGAGTTQFYGQPTRLPFDSVEVLTSLSGSGEPATVRLYEICGNR